jgi:hypothetical protein
MAKNISKRDNKDQSSAFIEAARALECDESEDRFDAALRKVGKAKLTHPPRPGKGASPSAAKSEKEKPAK